MSEQRRETVMGLVTGPVEAAGFDVEDVKVAGGGARTVVTVVVDSDRGLGMDDVVAVTELVSEILDRERFLGERPYTLEVTSPGVDRPLTAPRHWRRSRGRRAAVTVDGRVLRARIGRLDDAEAPTTVELAVPAKGGPVVREVPLAEIERAVVEVEFGKADPRELALTGTSADAGGDVAATVVDAEEGNDK